MIVSVWLEKYSQPIEFQEPHNTYIKNGMYCIFEKESNRITKYPVEKIFRIEILQAVSRTDSNYKSKNVEIFLEDTQSSIRKLVSNAYTNSKFYILKSIVDYPVEDDKEQPFLEKLEMYPVAHILKVVESYY